MNKQDAVIIVTNNNYKKFIGGSNKFLLEMIENFRKSHVESIVILPIYGINNRLKSADFFYVGVYYQNQFIGIYKLNDILGGLIQIQQEYNLNYKNIIINHLENWDLPALLNLLRNIYLPVNIIVHDFCMVCDYYMKPDGNGDICMKSYSLPGEEKCKECKYKDLEIDYFKKINLFLSSIEPLINSVIFPSEFTMNYGIKFFPVLKQKSVIREHLIIKNHNANNQLNKKKDNKKIKIAYIGAFVRHKGCFEWKLLLEKLSDDPDMEFYYIGQETFFDQDNRVVHLAADYNKGQTTDQILKEANIDVAFLWSTLPETYSYTYYEAMSANCFVITGAFSGNISAQVKKNKNGKAFDNINECANYLKSNEFVNDLVEFKANHNGCELFLNDSTEHLVTDCPGYKIEGKAAKPNRFLTSLYKQIRDY